MILGLEGTVPFAIVCFLGGMIVGAVLMALIPRHRKEAQFDD